MFVCLFFHAFVIKNSQTISFIAVCAVLSLLRLFAGFGGSLPTLFEEKRHMNGSVEFLH